MAGWIVLLHPCTYLRVWIVSDFPLVIQTMTGSWGGGGEERVTVGPKSSELPGDPDCCGATVLVTDS